MRGDEWTGAALALPFGGGDDPSSGLSGGLIAVLIVAVLVLPPVLIGIALRVRDRRRGGDVSRIEKQTENPPESSVFGTEWGRDGPAPLLRRSTRNDWAIVAALAAAVLLYFLVTNL